MTKIQLQYLPNMITFFRFFLIVPFQWVLLTENYRLAFCLFLCASLSDFLDGLLARLNDWVSHLGAFLDPLADKLLIATSFITLTYLSQLSLGFSVIVIGRDLGIVVGTMAYRYWIGPVNYKPFLMSKLNTCLQLGLILALVFNKGFMPLPFAFLNGVKYLVLMTTVVSFIQYIWVWGKLACQYSKTAFDLNKGHE